jgi:uncharacterized protein
MRAPRDDQTMASIPAAPPIQIRAMVIALAALGVLGAILAGSAPRLALLLAIGAALGVTLFHASFGFASAYRRWIVAGDAGAMRAQLAMLAAATILCAPLLALGELAGQSISGFVAPLSVALISGAFLFGIGMQLAGGCGSGTLYTAGGGNLRMAVVLAAFIAGSFAGSLHQPAWDRLASLPAVSLGESLGYAPGAALQLAAIAILALWLHGHALPRSNRATNFLRGPWPILAGAIGLAVLNAATLALAGHPWGITWAFALWGAKLARFAGWSPDSSEFWSQDWPRAALDAPLLADTVSVMDFGLILGAALAAALAGRFAPGWRIPARSLAAAIIGGLLMGYGARLASGCNVGAFFSGVASLSLHGWLWIAAALPGSWLGVRMRPLFGLSNDPR